MPFADFISRLMPIIEADEEYSAHFPPSSWKRVYDTGAAQPSGTLHFDARRLNDEILGGTKLHDIAIPFARHLNAEFGTDEETSEGARTDEDSQAPEPESQQEMAGAEIWTDADGEITEVRPVPAFSSPGPGVGSPASPVQDGSQSEVAGPSSEGSEARAGAGPARQEEPAGPVWKFPIYDFSREDLPEPLPPVLISVLSTGGLRYTWEDPGLGEVYRVTTSDTDPPFNPDDLQEASVTQAHHAEDPDPLTSSIRFVTIWAYEVVDAEEGVLGQARRIAEGIHIRPLEDWAVSYEPREQTVYARWKAPNFPPHMRATIRTAKLPVGENAGRYLRNQSWLTSQFAIQNNGYGFQDAAPEPGRRHTYVAALEVEVDGSTRLSVPEYRTITPAAEPDRIQDLELEAVTLDGVEQLRLTWTQRRGTRMNFYRANTPTDQEAVARGIIAGDLLARAGLTEDLRVRNIAHPTGELTAEGREQWVIENLHWPQGTEWDTIHLTPVSEADEGRVVIGKPVQRRRAGRVEGITVVQRMNWQLVTFTWPGEAIAVELRIGPLNSEAPTDSPAYLTVEKQEYERNGGFRIDGGLPPQGCRLFLTSVTHYQGQRIPSEPTVAAVEPLWGYLYQVQWSGHRAGGRGGLFSRATAFRRQTTAEIQISAVFGACPEHEVPQLVLVHNNERLPLHAGDGRRVDLFLEPPGGQEQPGTVTHVPAPSVGTRSAWFDHSAHGTGWYRLLVEAPPAASLAPFERRTALERYALADPSLDHLWLR